MAATYSPIHSSKDVVSEPSLPVGYWSLRPYTVRFTPGISRKNLSQQEDEPAKAGMLHMAL